MMTVNVLDIFSLGVSSKLSTVLLYKVFSSSPDFYVMTFSTSTKKRGFSFWLTKKGTCKVRTLMTGILYRTFLVTHDTAYRVTEKLELGLL